MNTSLNSGKLFNYQKTISTHLLPYVYSSLIHPSIHAHLYHLPFIILLCGLLSISFNKLLLFISNSYFIFLLFIIHITIVIYHQRQQPNYITVIFYIFLFHELYNTMYTNKYHQL